MQDNLSTGNKQNVDMFVSNTNYSFIEGSIQNLDLCLSACESVDFVLHQAAWGSVPRSIKMPLTYEDINVKGTLNMLEASKQMKVKNLFMLQVHQYMVMNLIYLKKRERR